MWWGAVSQHLPETTATQITSEYGTDVMSVKKLSKTHPKSSLNTQGKKFHEQNKEQIAD